MTKEFSGYHSIYILQDVRLLVFPEDSLLNSERFSRQALIEDILEEMPSPEKGGRLVNPCLEMSTRESVLRTMSCLAREHQMYLAYSFGDKVPCAGPGCPPDGHYLYNSIALLDDGGNFVAKYHKMQLYYEFHYNIPSDCPGHFNPVVTYDAPFGRLGFLVCYDLLFHSPGVELVEQYQVDTIIYATYWFNYVPFVGGVQMQQAFAMRHKVNFLASDVQTDEGPNLGLGIFSGRRGALAYSNSPDGDSKLVIATIPQKSGHPKAAKTCPAHPKKVVVSRLSAGWASKVANFQLNVSLVKVIPLDSALGEDFVEHCCPYSGICCSVFYHASNVQQFRREHFVLLFGNVTSGALGQERYPIRQEFCGMAACETANCSRFATTSHTRFHSVDLVAKLKSKYVYPGVVTSNLGLLPTSKWTYRTAQAGGKSTISVSKAKEPLVAVTLYGRLYEEDPPYKH